MFPDLFSSAYMYPSFESDEFDDLSEEFKKTVIKALDIPPEVFGYTEEELGMNEYEDEDYIE